MCPRNSLALTSINEGLNVKVIFSYVIERLRVCLNYKNDLLAWEFIIKVVLLVASSQFH